MEKEVAEILVEQNPDIKIYEDYSGRGMFGSTTTGIVVDDMNILREVIGQLLISGEEEEREIVGEWLIGGIRTDDLGLDKIIY
ncbi:MAG: hypothetical protein GF317_14890 [Candidatus Lokiarchaeota archaeon]|nr:hypothetical protein [Candidatus Lokiarchaeota archaeon]